MKNYLPAVLPVLIASFSVYAEDVTTPIETTLVTATRTEQTIENSLAPATIFTRADIETLQSKSVIDILSRVPGVEISQSGSKGSVTSMYLRGTSDDHTLFLIDGQRISSATNGSTSFQLIDPEQIERIEVVRGPRSSIYGSDAIGGVVQVFTKKGSEKPTHYLRTGAGSNSTWQLAAGSLGQISGVHYSINASHIESEGFDSIQEDTPPNDDDDGFRNSSASINLGYDFSYGGVLNFNYFYTKAKTESDDSFPPISSQPYAKSWIQSANLNFSSPVVGLWSTQIALGHSTDDSDNYDKLDPTERSSFRTSRDSILWQNDLALSEQQLLTLGVDYYDDDVTSTTTFTNQNGKVIKTRDNLAYFAVYQLSAGITDIQLGLREDDNEDFGTETTANASIGFEIGNKHKLIASYGEGFKTPTFNDLYWPITPYSYGNPNLKSETSESYELELRGNYENFNWAINYYQTDINNLIDWAPVDPLNPWTSPWTPSNIDNVEIEGAEIMVSTELAGWHVSGSFQYLEAEDADTGNQLPNRPKKGIVVDIDKHFGLWQLGFGWQANSERYGDKTNNNVTAGYGILNARAAYQITAALKVQLKLNNLLDKEYQTRYNYNEDGANGFVTLTYTL